MAGFDNQFPEDITSHYSSLWNDNISWLPDFNISLKQLYCLPDICDQEGKSVDVHVVLSNIANSDIKITLLQGGAGIGKSAFVAYLSNSISNYGEDVGIMVWTLPKSKSLLRIVMGECERYSQNNNLKRMILVFENYYGYQIDIDDICKTIKQRQETWYPNISVILTCREVETKGESADCCLLYIQPLSMDKISSIIQRVQMYGSKSNTNKAIHSFYNDFERDVFSLYYNFGKDTIGNPVVLLTILSAFIHNKKITTNSDIYSLMLNNLGFDRSHVLLETIAILTFVWKTNAVTVESLFMELQKDETSCSKYNSINAISYEIENQLKGICKISENRIFFVHKLYQDYFLSRFLFNQINQIDVSRNKNPDLLDRILVSGIIDKNVISLLESHLTNTECTQKDKAQKKWSQLFSAFLLGEFNTIYGKKEYNSFSKLFDQEMALFYNITAIYRCILKSNNSPEFLLSNNQSKSKLIDYLELYSVSGYKDSIDLSKMDFSKLDFSNHSLSKIDFSYCNLARCCFKKTKMSDVVFVASNLYNSDLSSSHLIQVDLTNANLKGADLSDSIVHSCSLRTANLHCTDLSRSTLRDVDCSNANFHGANLDATICKQVNFHSANMAKSYLYSTILSDVVLEGTNLTGAFLNLDDINHTTTE